MRGLPNNSESAKPAIHAGSSDSTFMASSKVGNGSGWAIDDNSRKLQVRCGRSRLFHQAGGSEGIGEHYHANSSKIFLAKYNLQIQSSKS
jgi:hypothetical protein